MFRDPNRLPPHRRQPNVLLLVLATLLGAACLLYGSVNLWSTQYNVVSLSSAATSSIILTIIGTLVTIATPILYIRNKLRESLIASLLVSGTRISCNIKHHRYLSTRGGLVKNKFYLEGLDLVTHQPRTYSSDWILGDTDYAVGAYPNRPVSIDVYVNPNNPGEYYIDPNSIPTGPQ